MLVISPNLPSSVSGPWLCPPGNCPVLGLNRLLDTLKLGHKKGKRIRKMEVPTDKPTNYELWDTAADTQRRSKEREQRDG